MIKKLSFVVLLVLAAATYAWASTTTANMSLLIPSTGDTDYPTSISTSFTLIDAHDHTTGKGVQIAAGGIATNAVTSAKILASNVTTVKIADNNVTQAKLALRPDGTAAGEIAVSSSTGSFGGTATSITDITNATVTLTTLGRPVMITFISGATSDGSGIFYSTETGTDVTATSYLYFDRGGSTIATTGVVGWPNGVDTPDKLVSSPCSAISYIDRVAAGTYTYKMRYKSLSGTTTTGVTNCKMIAYEM